MTPQEIKSRLKKKKITQAALERRFKVSDTAISFLVNRKLTSERLEKRLARILGVTLEQLRTNSNDAA